MINLFYYTGLIYWSIAGLSLVLWLHLYLRNRFKIYDEFWEMVAIPWMLYNVSNYNKADLEYFIKTEQTTLTDFSERILKKYARKRLSKIK